MRPIADGPDTVPCDVPDEAPVDALVESTLERHGRLDPAVNAAAGIVDPTLLTELPTEEWHRIVAVNLPGALYCLRAEVRTMRAARTPSPRKWARGDKGLEAMAGGNPMSRLA